jgi:hypothetical protein
MLLLELDDGFIVMPDPAGHDGRRFAHELLVYLRTNQLPFLIGGEHEQAILTIGPVPAPQRERLRNWWDLRKRTASSEPPTRRCLCAVPHSSLIPCRAAQ